MKKILLHLVTLSILLSSTHVVSAQTVEIGINPPVAELIMKPRTDVTISYEIVNAADPSIIELSVVSARPEGNNGTMSLSSTIDNDLIFELQGSKNNKSSFFMGGGSKRKVSLKIKIPEAARDGDYYMSLLARVVNPQSMGMKSGVSIQPGVTSSLLISVASEDGFENKPQLGDFSISPRFRLKFGKRLFNIIDSTDILPVNLTVKNKGKHLIKPNGTISVRNSFNNKASFTLLPVSILKSSSRIIPAISGGACIDPRCQSSSLLLSGFFLGKNSIDLNVNFGPGSTKITGTAIFYALPLKLSLIIGLILILIYLFLKTSRSQ